MTTEELATIMDARTTEKIRAFILAGREELAPRTDPAAPPRTAEVAEAAPVALEVAPPAAHAMEEHPPDAKAGQATELASGELELVSAVEQEAAESEAVSTEDLASGESDVAPAAEQAPAALANEADLDEGNHEITA